MAEAALSPIPGMVYVVSLLGTTGMRDQEEADVKRAEHKLKACDRYFQTVKIERFRASMSRDAFEPVCAWATVRLELAQARDLLPPSADDTTAKTARRSKPPHSPRSTMVGKSLAMAKTPLHFTDYSEYSMEKAVGAAA